MKEKAAKIVMITSLSIIGVLILSVILLSVITVNKGFKFNQTPDTIVLHHGSEQISLFSDLEEKQNGMFSEVINKVESAGLFKVRDAWFGGYSSKNDGTEYLSTAVTFSTLYSSSNSYCIQYGWHAAQKTSYVKDGKTTEFSYNAAYFVVTEENNVKQVKAYLKEAGKDQTYSRVAYFSYLNTAELYEYLAGLNYAI